VAAPRPKPAGKPRPAPRLPTLTNQTKIYWPGEGITKGDMLAYYARVAPVMIPHLKDRPQSLHRHPNGIEGESFFQKEMAGQLPRWAETVTVPSGNAGGSITYVLCQNAETLLYMANLGCIEINAWNARTPTLDCPDYVVVDLDPNEAPFGVVIDVALAVKRLLDELGAEGFCKTSGSRGLHIYVPLEPRYSHDQVRVFAELLSRCINQKMSAQTSVERLPARRIGRVYLDYLQNRRGSTMAAAYSIRPRPGATVSTPLRWSEVNARLDPTVFTIKTVFDRLDRWGDLFAGVLTGRTDLQQCFARLRERIG
jgi:bifunctional non-homologous end joining protein LigD